MKICFDMDGTIANFYGVNGWLEYLQNFDDTPYRQAEPLLRMSSLARVLNRLQRQGYEICVISWLSKCSCDEFDARVTQTKIEWLHKHLPSVQWNEIHIVEYGSPKEQFCCSFDDILFDDEYNNRKNWNGQAFDVDCIMDILKEL